MTRKQENEKMRNSFIKELMDFIESQGNEAIRIKNNEVAFPIVYENGDEAFMKIAVSIPSGSRDGDIFDAYSLAEEYVINEKKKKEIAERKAEEKQKKIARDEKQREQVLFVFSGNSLSLYPVFAICNSFLYIVVCKFPAFLIKFPI